MSAVTRAVKGVLKGVGNLVSSVWDTVESAVSSVWDELVMPVLETVFEVFGITDETIIEVQSISNKLIADEDSDLYKKALTSAALIDNRLDTGIAENFINNVQTYSRSVKKFYNYGVSTYDNGLPEASVGSLVSDNVAIATAIDTDTSVVGSTVTSSRSGIPTQDEQFHYYLQNNNSYIPSTGTLTFKDKFGNTYSDYTIGSYYYNIVKNYYEITVNRIAQSVSISITGDVNIVEGSTGSYKVEVSSAVPAGTLVTVPIIYSGTATDGTDFTSTEVVTLYENTTSSLFNIPTTENVATGDKTLVMTLGEAVPSVGGFEVVTNNPNSSSLTVNIVDNETLSLAVNAVTTSENSGVLSCDITLSSNTTAFTVDYVLTDQTAISGTDYTDNSGTINFLGLAGETVTVDIPILIDVTVEVPETFVISLTNSSNALVTIADTAVLTIEEYQPISTSVSDVIIVPTYTSKQSIISKYYTSDVNVWSYWIYDIAKGTYPDTEFTLSTSTNLEMLPIVAIREDATNINADKTTSSYKTTKKLLDSLYIDLDDLTTNLTDNPSITDIDDCFIHFSLNPIDTGAEVSKVLFETLAVFATGASTGTDNEGYLATFTEGTFKKSIVWNTQTDSLVTASIGVVGTYLHNVSGTTLTVQKQVSSTEYRELVFTSVSSADFIDKDGLHDMSIHKLGDSGFNIPVSYFILSTLSHREQLNLYPSMLRMSIYAATVTELEWYETSAFWSLVSIVVTVIAIISLDFSGGINAFVQSLLTQYAIGETVSAIVSNIDDPVVRAAVAVALTYGAGKLTGSIGKTITAENMVMLVSNFSNTLGNAYGEDTIENQQKLEEYNSKLEDRMKEIEDANKPSNVDPSLVATLNSIDTLLYTARQVQYDFSNSYDYDTLVGNYTTNKLLIGVT